MARENGPNDEPGVKDGHFRTSTPPRKAIGDKSSREWGWNVRLLHCPGLLAIAAVLGLLAGRASAHPSSGIVVDERGNVFVADINTGLWKIEPDGKLTRVHEEAGHWLALDAGGRFARVDFTKSGHWPRWFKRRTPDGAAPALITDGGSPLVVHRDGDLYYVSGGEKRIPGGTELTRLSPEGTLRPFAPALGKLAENLGGIKGLAAGPAGSLYLTFPKAVYKIATDGEVAALAESVPIEDAEKDLVEGTAREDLPSLRGLAVDDQGTAYVAATGCRTVVKVTADGKVETLLKAERPWSPTGVALHGGTVYVLEYPNANGSDHDDWVPRVRKVDRAGKVTLLATFPKRVGRDPVTRPSGGGEGQVP
jgi:sugar lactone lactonase YvrE